MRTIALFIGLVLVLTGCQDKKKPTPSNLIRGSGGLHTVVLIHAKGADFSFDAHNMTEGEVTLRYVSPMIVYLADEPLQRSESMELSEFLAAWKKGEFKTDPAIDNAGFFAFEDVGHELADITFNVENPRFIQGSQMLTLDIVSWASKQNKKVDHLDDVTIYIEGRWKKVPPVGEES